MDDRIKYIELLFCSTGQIRHDLNSLDAVGPIYVRVGPNSNQAKEVQSLAHYIQQELAHLKRACAETEALEKEVTVDPNDEPGKQDKELRMRDIKSVRGEIDEESKKTYTMLAAVLDKHKEVRDEYE